MIDVEKLIKICDAYGVEVVNETTQEHQIAKQLCEEMGIKWVIGAKHPLLNGKEIKNFSIRKLFEDPNYLTN